MKRIVSDGRTYYVNKFDCEDGRHVAEVWERYDGHSTLTYIGNMKLGSVTSRKLPLALAIMPRCDERVAAVHAYHRELEHLRDTLLAMAS